MGFGLSCARKGVNVPNEEKTLIDREGNLGTSATVKAKVKAFNSLNLWKLQDRDSKSEVK